VEGLQKEEVELVAVVGFAIGEMFVESIVDRRSHTLPELAWPNTLPSFTTLQELDDFCKRLGEFLLYTATVRFGLRFEESVHATCFADPWKLLSLANALECRIGVTGEAHVHEAT
jgi:hypothetical protein